MGLGGCGGGSGDRAAVPWRAGLISHEVRITKPVSPDDPEAIEVIRSGRSVVIADARPALNLKPGRSATALLPIDSDGRLEITAARRRPAKEAGLAVNWEGGGHLEIRLLEDGWQVGSIEPVGEPGGALEVTMRAEDGPVVVALPHRPAAVDDRPSLLIISLDTLRADRLGCYGYERATSPRIDAVAEHGVRFANALSPSSWTLPAYASLLTGLLPSEHGAGRTPDGGSKRGISDEVPSLVEDLAKAGWRTESVYANPFLSTGFGLARGYERHVRYGYHAGAGVDMALESLERIGDQPFVLFVQFVDSHAPYATPREFGYAWARRPFEETALMERRQRRLDPPDTDAEQVEMGDHYDETVRYSDAQVGRLLDAMDTAGQLDNTLVVIHSDHGEEFWEHGSYGHGHSVHGEVARVPLILRWEGQLPAGAVVEGTVGVHALMPWVLAQFGVDSSGGAELAEVLAGGIEGAAVTAGTLFNPPRIAFTTGSWRLLEEAGGGAAALFDTAADPLETHNLATERPEVAAALRLRRNRMLAARTGAAGPGAAVTDQDIAAELEALGYVDEED